MQINLIKKIKILKTIETGITPGSDGLPAEFYKNFLERYIETTYQSTQFFVRHGMPFHHPEKRHYQTHPKERHRAPTTSRTGDP